jgi:osmotically-inducible protein OsmY
MASVWPYSGDDEWARDDGWFGDDDPPMGEDEILVDVVAGRLMAESRISGRRVIVTVQNRVVILEGEVDSEDAKQAAGSRAWSTPGVFDVCNLLVARSAAT